MRATATPRGIVATSRASRIALVLEGPQQRYNFSYEELQAFPDSMLARAVGETTDSTALGPVVWQLTSMPKSPLTSSPEAAAIAQSLYRYQHITPDIMTLALKAVAGNPKAADPYKAPYERLAELLAYLALPGPVSQWLPPVSSVRLIHCNVLTFIFHCKEIEYDYGVKMLAQRAVETMLSYRPFSDVAAAGGVVNSQRDRLAVFAVEYAQHRGESLKVYAVDVAYATEDLARAYEQWLASMQVESSGVTDVMPHTVTHDLAKHLRFTEILPNGATCDTAVGVADVSVQRFVGTSLSTPEAPGQLVSHMKGAFRRLAGGTALNLLEVRVHCVAHVHLVVGGYPTKVRTDFVHLLAVCW